MRLVAENVEQVVASLKEELTRQRARLDHLKGQPRTGPGVRQRELDQQYVMGRITTLEEVIEALSSIPSTDPAWAPRDGTVKL